MKSPSNALAPRLNAIRVERHPQIRQKRLDAGRRGDDDGKRPRSRPCCGAVEGRACLAEPRLVSEYEPASANDAPGIAEAGVDAGLTHREPTEDERLDREDARRARHFDIVPQLEPRAVEQNGFLREPEEGARRQRELGSDAGRRTVAAIDSFRRNRGRFDLGALC
ncbi:MAG TPA: hypothetical protein VMI72_16935 [Roseiarcus sp.]|nr:hypothetical protein [Roseiarcus sp.]